MKRSDLRAIAQKKAEAQYKNNQRQKQKTRKLPPPTARIGDRDPSTGKDKVIYENGGQVIAGNRLFNVSLPYGAEVRASQPYGSQIIALDSKSSFIKKPKQVPKQVKPRSKKYEIKLDIAILYAVREEKDYPVSFVNPTWEMQHTNEGYVCVPVPQGYRGIYPTEAACMSEANKYRQELIDSIDAYNEQLIKNYEAAVRRYERRLEAVYGSLPLMFPEYPELIPHESISVESQNPGNVAISFYLKHNLKAEAVKLLEINEKEIFEAILVNSNNLIIPIVKLGSAKQSVFLIDIVDGGRGSGSEGGGRNGNEDNYGYWDVVDQEAWYSINFFDSLPEPIAKENIYPSTISLANNSKEIEGDYQNWRFFSYLFYPYPVGHSCGVGNTYLSQEELEDKYKAVADHQAFTNIYQSTEIAEVELLDNSFTGKTYSFLGEPLEETINTESINLEVIAYEFNQEALTCDKNIILEENFDITLPPTTVLLIMKGIKI